MNEIELGCFGLPHKNGGCFFTILNSQTLEWAGTFQAKDLDSLYWLAKVMNIKNFENIDLEATKKRFNEYTGIVFDDGVNHV